MNSIQQIAAVLHDAYFFDPKNWSSRMSYPNLPQIVDTIKRLFNQLNEQNSSYLLVGGVAMLNYVNGRNTKDVDLIINDEVLVTLSGINVLSKNQNFVRASYDGIQLDLLLAQNQLFRQVQQKYKTEIYWDDLKISCATPMGLVILKFYALPSFYLQRQFDRASLYESDILQLLCHHSVDLESAIREVEPHLTLYDCAEIRKIAQEIQKRMMRMASCFQPQPEV